MKNTIRFSLTICLIVILNVVIAQIPTDSLVSYYSFNSNANDSTTNGFHGTLNGQTLDTGICSNAYLFNNNYIDCGDPVNNLFDLTQNATLCLWVKLKNMPANYYTLIGKDVSAGNNVKKWFFAIHNNKISFHINGPGWGGGYWSYSNNYSFQLNTFYHFAVVKNNNDYTFYINGQNYGTQSLPFNLLDVPFNLRIGKNEIANIQAVMDEVYIYNKALTQSEINKLYINCITNINSVLSATVITIHPNPLINQLTIDTYGKTISNATILIFNTHKQPVYSQTQLQLINTFSIKLPNLPNGVYFVQISTQDGFVMNSKIIKQ